MLFEAKVIHFTLEEPEDYRRLEIAEKFLEERGGFHISKNGADVFLIFGFQQDLYDYNQLTLKELDVGYDIMSENDLAELDRQRKYIKERFSQKQKE